MLMAIVRITFLLMHQQDTGAIQSSDCSLAGPAVQKRTLRNDDLKGPRA